jgi:Leucine-rich repeat (LRR) protein
MKFLRFNKGSDVMADSDYFRENGYDFLVTGGDIPDDWGDNGEKKAFVRIKQTGGDVPDDNWMQRLWAWADKNNIDEKKLPRDNSGVTNLQTLELYNNNIKELPKEIGQLTHLQKLSLSKNKLTELPKEIGQLTQLQILNLDGNKLTELPKEIGQLTNLQRLGLYNNNLTELPREIGQLTNLQNLYLSGNKLTELPKEIGQLTQLQILNLDGNKLTELPKEIGQLTNLQKLFFCDNSLTELPKELFNHVDGDVILRNLKSKLKVKKKSKAEIINICAISTRGSTSKPFKIYLTDKDVKLPEQFVLRLDSAADLSNGSEALKISNYGLNLIATHSKAYLEETLKGFRRRLDSETYLLVKQDEDGLPDFMSEPGFSDDFRIKEEPSFFETFQDAKNWAIKNSGRTFTRSSNGQGFVPNNHSCRYNNFPANKSDTSPIKQANRFIGLNGFAVAESVKCFLARLSPHLLSMYTNNHIYFSKNTFIQELNKLSKDEIQELEMVLTEYFEASVAKRKLKLKGLKVCKYDIVKKVGKKDGEKRYRWINAIEVSIDLMR